MSRTSTDAPFQWKRAIIAQRCGSCDLSVGRSLTLTLAFCCRVGVWATLPTGAAPPASRVLRIAARLPPAALDPRASAPPDSMRKGRSEPCPQPRGPDEKREFGSEERPTDVS